MLVCITGFIIFPKSFYIMGLNLMGANNNDQKCIF